VSTDSIDMSKALFQSLAALSTGMIDVEWGFTN
jgi:hypothetical protein